jgi:glycosyltransferase involved in cell wall biosynthesis
MKIILCKGQFLGPMSGADETLVNYATQLHKAGHSVSVLLLYPYLPQDEYYVRLRETGISVHSVASNSSRTLLGSGRKIARWLMSAFPSAQYLLRTNGQRLATNIALRYRKQCREFLEQSCANIVHVLTPDPGGMVLISAAHDAGIPVMYQEVGMPYHPPIYASYYEHFTTVLPLCAEVTALSPLLAQLCRERLPYPNKLSVLPIMTEDLRNGHISPRESTDITIGFAARMDHLKGPMILLEAFAIASRRFDGLRLSIAGAGALKQEFTERAQALGVASRCEFTGVYAGPRERRSFMERLDIFALPSITEGTPNSVIEAMALGLPIVASDVGGIPDVVSADAGILIQTKDSGAMAEAIIRLARDPQLRKRMGEGARKRYEQLFSPEAVLPLLLDTYQRLAGGELPESPASSKNCGIHPWARAEVVWI